MSERIYIFDTTLRDGAQMEGVTFSLEDKLDIISRLDSLGVDFIEGGMPMSNPTDTKLFRKLPDSKAKVTAFGSTIRPGSSADTDPGLRNLVESDAEWVCIFGKSWRFHLNKVLRISDKENLRMIRDSIEYLKFSGKKVIFDAEHFFDGYKDDRDFALDVVRTAYDAGADWVCLCDTNGGCLPGQISDAVKDVKASCDARIGIHCHNDSDMAVACSLAAVDAGARMVQGTINGLGERCGNANLCSVIPNLVFKMGYETCMDLTKLTGASYAISDIANKHQDPSLPYVGSRAFTHKGGMHIDALIKDPHTYEHITPEMVGNHRTLIVSELTGKAGISKKLEELGVKNTPENVNKVLAMIKNMEGDGYQFEAADASLELLIRRECEGLEKPFSVPVFRIFMDETGDYEIKSEASIKVKDMEGHIEHTAADGNGPVDALSNALKKALSTFFPVITKIRLIDYKVRVLDEKAATAAPVRVMVRTTDGKCQWNTVGVSTNVIEASFIALLDAVEYAVFKHTEKVN